MITANILKSLTSRNESPGYTLLITGYETGNDCNSEYIKIKMHQINQGINIIENGFDPINKELIIKSALDFDEKDKLFKSKLIGSSNIKTGKTMLDEGESINSHYIEGIVTTLSDEVEVEFNKTYENIPNIYITMDKKTKALFKNYEFDFGEEIENGYTGVKIIFNELRNREQYPDINILIIGDEIVDTGSD